MKICFFSDIHGNLFAFEAFIEQIQVQEIDMCIFGGDVFGYYYHADEVLDILRRRKIKCLLGNHDKMFLELLTGKRNEKELIQRFGQSYNGIITKIKTENIEFLKTLKASCKLEIEGMKIGFFHGGPDNPLEMRIYPDTPIEDESIFSEYDFAFLGHTHCKMVRSIGKCVIINPGSVGQQRDGKGCSYVIFDTISKEIEFFGIEYDEKKLVDEINRIEVDENMKQRLTEVIFRKNRK